MVMHAHEISPQLLIRWVRDAKVVQQHGWSLAQTTTHAAQHAGSHYVYVYDALSTSTTGFSAYIAKDADRTYHATSLATTHIKLGDGHPQTQSLCVSVCVTRQLTEEAVPGV